jgi:DNA-binding transcriptional LysR family regulator
VERHEIEIFLTLAEELHFGRTAERLRVSSAMVSQTVKKVERRIGAQLFERTSRKVLLTPLGQRLRADMRPHYDGLNEAIDRATEAARGIHGVLRVGFLGVQSGLTAHRAADMFQDRHPNCAVEFTEIQVSDYVTPLRTGALDMLVTLLPLDEPDISVGPLVVEGATLVAVPTSSPLAARTELCMDDLAGYAFPSLSERVPAAWADRLLPRSTPNGGAVHRTEQQCSTYQEMLALVVAGKAVVLGDEQVTRYYQRPEVTYLPIHDAPTLNHAVLWATAAENARMRAYADAVRELKATCASEG